MNDKDNNIDPRELLSGDASDVNDPLVNNSDSNTPAVNTESPVQLTCTLVLEILPEAVGGDLDEETLAIVARHIADCHACSREWVSLRNAYQSLQALRETTSQMPGLDDAFFAELHVDIIGEIRHQALMLHDARQLVATVPTVVPHAPSRVASILPKLLALAATLLLGIFLGSMSGATSDHNLDPGGGNSTGSVIPVSDVDDLAFWEQYRELLNTFNESSLKHREASNPKKLSIPPAGDDM